MARALAIILAGLVWAGCTGLDPVETVEAELPDADIRLLFIGNSLTDANNLAALTMTVAEAAGLELAVGVVAFSGASLEDHWNLGTAASAIERWRPTIAVMQQGPSSLPENQVHLRTWAARFADLIRAEGGEPALYMVWPEATRREAADAVRDSYKAAADSVDGYLIPAGEAWREAWDEDPGAPLYSGDGYHPSQLGSVLVALTAVRVLFDQPVATLPDTITPYTEGLPVIRLTPEDGALLRAAAEDAAAEWGRTPGDP